MSQGVHSKPSNTILRIVIFLLLLLFFFGLYCYVNSRKEIIETSEEGTIDIIQDTITTISQDTIATIPQKDTITTIQEVSVISTKEIEKPKGTSVKPKKNKKKKERVEPKNIYVESFIANKSRKSNKSENVEDISLFVFNSNNKIDNALSNRFIEEFDNKGYAAYPSFIVSNHLTLEVIHNLTSRNIDYFKGNLEKYVNYICVAKVFYSYGENVLRQDMLNCNMKVDYLIYSSETGELMLSESDLIIGTGFKKIEARKDAIEKFIL